MGKPAARETERLGSAALRKLEHPRLRDPAKPYRRRRDGTVATKMIGDQIKT
jgi:hypothetical protein